ncbi:MAG: prepilin-type N-terminal cleavage/methylation domain-containing protein [Eubacteriales bacterium]|nr:prepilin-type N-terminal cleavage/methylation domain-containing protein [Eubacteriales bacterium]
MKRKNGGFTLIETLITIVIVSVVALLMYSFFGQGFSLYSVETNSADEQMSQRQVLSDITNKARLTDPGSIAYADGVLTIDDYAYTFAGGSILRNNTVIANGISAFNVSIDQNILEIGIVNTAGTEISTSLSLSQ